MGHKAIKGGKSYNTDTALLVYSVPYADEFRYAALYQTKQGAFFVWWYDASDGEGAIKPLSDEAALKWLETHQAPAETIKRYFDAIPERAGSEMRITIRLPGNLYHKVSISAKNCKMSINTYIMRVLDRSESPQRT